MDRGGRGHGGRGVSRQSSSLPRTLHGSLLQSEAEAGAETTDTYHGEPQQAAQVEGTYLGNTPSYGSHYRDTRGTTAHSTPIAPVPATYTYEDTSHQGTSSIQRIHNTSYERSLPQESPPSTLPLPPIQSPTGQYRQLHPEVQVTSRYSELQSYASTPTPRRSNVSQQYSSPIPQYSRIGNVPLPSISIIHQNEPVAGPSSYPSQRYDTQQQALDYRQRRWTPQPVDRPMASLPRVGRTTQSQQQVQQVPLGWSYQYAGSSSESYQGVQQTQAMMGSWSSGQGELAAQSSRYTPSHHSAYATVSADRSTISPESAYASTSRSAQYQYGVPITAPQPRRVVQGSQGVYTPYYYGGQPAAPQYEPPPQALPQYSPPAVPVPEEPQPVPQAQEEYIPEPVPAPEPAPALGSEPAVAEVQPVAPYDPGPSQEVAYAEEREKSATPSVESATSNPQKRKKKSDTETSEDEPPRRPKKTSIACHFCRARKLKCDGQPICGNCARRKLPCAYASEARRRGPGKAPKGQKKHARARGQGVADPSSSTPQELPSQEPPAQERSRARRSGPRVSSSSPPPTHQQPSPSFGSGDNFDFDFERGSSPLSASADPTSAEQYRRIFELPPGFSDYQHQSSYNTSLTGRMAGGPSSGVPWASASPSSSSTTNVQGAAMGSDPGRQEYSGPSGSRLSPQYFSELQQLQPRQQGQQGQHQHGQAQPPQQPETPPR